MLSSVSSSGAGLEHGIKDSEWNALFAAYGHNPNKEQQMALETICNNYLLDRRTELNAMPVSILRDYFQKVQKAIDEFSKYAYGSLSPFDDAGHALNSVLDAMLREQSFGVNGNDVVRQNTDTMRYEAIGTESEQLRIKLSQTTLMNIGVAVAVATEKSKQQLAEMIVDKTSGFQPGEAFKIWLLDMKEWAKQNQFRYGPHVNPATSDQKQSAFSEFLFEINRLFPKEYRESVKNAGAMADRLKNAKKSPSRRRDRGK